ncbi:sensor domain-containing diguanylate cyclase [Aeromonas salmonicida]|uniref:sensor domain-containing diguanylate cyclase n=1 Tax=Aeromonas salmonicida TaxID=645 RepID=UPI0031FDDA81
MPEKRIHIVTRCLQWLLGSLVILLLALTLHQTLKQVTELNEQDTLHTAVHLQSQFQQIATFLEAIRGQAEERLRSNPQSALTRQLYQALHTDPELGFSLDKIPANLPAGLSGNLTGLGRLPAPGSEREARLHLALSLSPLLSTAAKLLEDKVAWVYFTGVDDFIYVYPWVSSNHFHFQRRLYKQSYWLDALKPQNPSQSVIISRPYADTAGKGMMVTLSKPIMRDQTLVGVISMDILLSHIEHMLREHAPHIGTLYLVNQDHQILASSAQEANFIPQPQADKNHYHWRQWSLQRAHVMPNTQLTLNHHITLHTVIQTLLSQSAPTLIAMLCMVLATLFSLKARRLNRQLDYLSSHDALTGTYNRHYFDEFERLHLRAKAREVGVVMFDCDHFKQVNDRFGHEVGDQVLIRLVTLCQPLLKKEDALIRWGGEEFLLLARGRDPLEQLAERLRLQIAEHPWEEIAPDLAVTISLGYHHCLAGTPLKEAIHRADLALYQAKANGRNRSEGWQDDGAKNTG